MSDSNQTLALDLFPMWDRYMKPMSIYDIEFDRAQIEAYIWSLYVLSHAYYSLQKLLTRCH